jgi:hypothetical protein
MKNKILLSTILLSLLAKATPGLSDELISNLGESNDSSQSAGASLGFGIGFDTGSAAFKLDSVTLEQFLYDPSANASLHVLLYKLDFAAGNPNPTMTLLGELGNPTVDPTDTQLPGATFVAYSPLVPIMLQPSSQYIVAALTDPSGSTGPILLFTASDSFTGLPDWQLGNDYSVEQFGTDVSWGTPFEAGHLKFRIDGSVPPNRPPDVSQAHPSIATIWPPNGRFVQFNILGVTDPDGDPITIAINAIQQDEPVVTPGADSTSPDAILDGSGTASVRAERLNSGNGRVYRISFTATDGKPNGTTSGVVYIQVPHDRGSQPVAIDDGPVTGYFDSTAQFSVSPFGTTSNPPRK